MATAPSFALSLQAAGAVTSTVGAYYSAKSSKSSLEYESNVASQNARLAELSAQSELVKGEREYQSHKLKSAQLKSSQRVAFAANGVDLGEGNALDVLTGTDVMSEIDANTITSNAINAAWGYRTQAQNYKSEARIKKATGKSISTGMATATSLLSGAGQVASSWYMFDKLGAFDESAAKTKYTGMEG